MLCRASQLFQVFDLSHGLHSFLIRQFQYVDLLDDIELLIQLILDKGSLLRTVKISFSQVSTIIIIEHSPTVLQVRNFNNLSCPKLPRPRTFSILNWSIFSNNSARNYDSHIVLYSVSMFDQ